MWVSHADALPHAPITRPLPTPIPEDIEETLEFEVGKIDPPHCRHRDGEGKEHQ